MPSFKAPQLPTQKSKPPRPARTGKLGGLPTLEPFAPPIPKPAPIAPDPKLRQRVQHGS